MLLYKTANPELTFTGHRSLLHGHGGLYIHMHELSELSPNLKHTQIEREREMGRGPCRSKKGEGLKKGAWTAQEDTLLTSYIMAHGEGKWTHVPKAAGLNRGGKSCRLRWLNYLRPDIKRGNITRDEEDLIIRLHKLLGNRWSLIAGRIPGRTDNEIKNYWNTTLSKKLRTQACSIMKPASASSPLIQTKPWKCKNVVIRHPPCPKESLLLSNQIEFQEADMMTTTHFTDQSQNSSPPPDQYRINVNGHINHQLKQISDHFDVNFLSQGNDVPCTDLYRESSVAMDSHNHQCQPVDQVMLNDWTTSCFEVDVNSLATWEMDSLALLLESEDWT